MGSDALRDVMETVRVVVLGDNSVESVCDFAKLTNVVGALLLCEVVLRIFFSVEVFAVKASTH